ncbi:transmembrane protein 187 [Lepus europaeus]|uniref:transmembrane protein 187 n=1 Tax=Lepus europaeus TaxID=9983 RepID=UPI002B486139|nr:transmembrane protein 187 [Lepus europaeus]XP_062040102.1 transmembrane protein 187 [Lepus europaeus]
MEPESRRALCHVALASCLCAAAVHTGVFAGVVVQVGHEHYAEVPVASLPAFLSMPCNSLVNLAYVCLGLYWLRRGASSPAARYLKDAFAAMALVYGPVQWLRIGTQAHPAAVLDQWFTLPIFAWPVAWCLSLDSGWKPWRLLAIEFLSLFSYSLALLHPQGFEVALGAHIVAAVGQALRTQGRHGNASTATYLALGVLSCLGFVVLKLWDHELAQCRLFQRLTGHFWSKLCDVLQFHFAFLFLTNVSRGQSLRPEGKPTARQH